MGQALYRKYRSKSLAEIVGQEHITTALTNALKSGRMSHAYLLTGPRGVGKTSIARILAHEINGLPYNDETHLDIIEIDAASNSSVEDIRDLRDKVHTAPSSGKYKVYIIDEVHMLSKSAFNALLKTLEEPPAHVVFVLATTEAHKLPETIISRTQRYSFRPVPMPQVVKHLRYITEQERLSVDDEALELIAERGEGSFRDSISLLDQASNTGDKVTKADVERLLGLAPSTLIQQLQAALQEHDSAQVVQQLQALYGAGYEPGMVAVQLGSMVRSDLLAGKQADTGASLQLLSDLLDVPTGRQPGQLLEIILLKASFSVSTTSPIGATSTPLATARPDVTPTQTPPPAPKAETTLAKPDIASPAALPVSEPAPTPEPISTDTPVPTPATEPPADLSELWQQVLNEIKKQYNTLYGIARMATPELNGDTLTLNLKFAFHQKRMNEAKNRKLIGDVVARLANRPLDIVCVVADKPIATDTKSAPDVSAISNIFGGAELLES